MRILGAFIGAMMLAACATETPYQAARSNDDNGYRDARIEQNRYRVSFAGNSMTDRETVENYLLYRSAELTLQAGYDYFIVHDRQTDEDKSIIPTGHGSSFGASYHDPFYDSWYSYRPGYGYYDRYSGRYYRNGYGWGPRHYGPTSYYEVKSYETTAEISMHRGRKPFDDRNAYNAHDVHQSLASYIRLPERT